MREDSRSWFRRRSTWRSIASAALAACVILVAACSTPTLEEESVEACKRYGFAKGSVELAQCAQKETFNRRDNEVMRSMYKTM